VRFGIRVGWTWMSLPGDEKVNYSAGRVLRATPEISGRQISKRGSIRQSWIISEFQASFRSFDAKGPCIASSDLVPAGGVGPCRNVRTRRADGTSAKQCATMSTITNFSFTRNLVVTHSARMVESITRSERVQAVLTVLAAKRPRTLDEAKFGTL